MEVSKARTKVKLLKNLEELGYNLDKNTTFNELEGILPAYIEAKSQRIISDFVIVPGDISTSKVYQIYVKKRNNSIFERNRERNK